MARLPRLAIAGLLHLLTQHARPGLALFDEAIDRQAYLDALREAATQQRLAIHAYGLMPDGEARLLVTPATDGALGRALQSVGRRFGAAYNRRHARTGGLWASRFRAVPVDPAAAFLRCLRFVEADDARASSVPHHLGLHGDPLVSDHAGYWQLGNTPFEREAAYARWRERGLTSEETMALRACLRGGWALGSQEFAAALQAHTTRRLVSGRPGRKTVPE